MTKEFSIPNNLSDMDKDYEIEKVQKQWEYFIKPQDGDIMIINGSWGAKFVYYENRWRPFA